MKSSDFFIVLSVMSIVLLNSCTSLSPVAEREQSPFVAVAEPLTPMQTKVQALQALPNLYKEQAGERQSALPTKTLKEFQAALALKQQGKIPQARKQFITLSEQHPDLSGIWLQLALLIKQQDKSQEKFDIEKRHKDMIRYLDNAISANPLNYLAHNELAQVLRKQGQFEQALSHYELAIKSWPAFAQGYLNRGILYDLYMGRKSLALADYELYQVLSNDSSRQLKGWIIDLQRQIKRAQQVTKIGAM
jgi:tetratricopeptide (TPR) repeat protein